MLSRRAYEETFLPAITLRILEIGLHISVTVPLEVRTIVLNLSRWHRRRSGCNAFLIGKGVFSETGDVRGG